MYENIKDNNYRILFIDPKGTAYANYKLKADGYSKIFRGKTFNNFKDKKIPSDLIITVDLFFYKISDVSISEGYKEYWIDKDQIKEIF
ncbi:MAG: hypothetical protein KAU01_04815 [Candidatus Cloacimonetes bacterium]|nr:hypothetical protein [Candidatus Cloacimonadota bacterium]